MFLRLWQEVTYLAFLLLFLLLLSQQDRQFLYITRALKHYDVSFSLSQQKKKKRKEKKCCMSYYCKPTKRKLLCPGHFTKHSDCYKILTLKTPSLYKSLLKMK